jgi:hypothetical protein
MAKLSHTAGTVCEMGQNSWANCIKSYGKECKNAVDKIKMIGKVEKSRSCRVPMQLSPGMELEFEHPGQLVGVNLVGLVVLKITVFKLVGKGTRNSL